MSGVNLGRWGSIPEVSERFRGESRGIIIIIVKFTPDVTSY